MKVSSKLKSYELIYLQHGVLHVPLESMYSKEFTEIDKFVISSNFEKENLIEKYNYKLEDLILSTMSRNNSQEFNITTTRTRKRIVFAPSWRKYLIGKLEDGKREIKTSAFENSTYFKEINNLFKSKELNKILEKYNIELIFQLHPIFKDYKNLFPFNDYIKPSEEGLNVYDCDLFITDFSSFQFDFIKLQKPLIYFIPDKKEFNAGLHTYRELYLKENNAFGPFVYNYEDLIINIKKIIENDWQTKKKYLHRMNKFFYNVSNPCDMIYETIKKENKTKKK